MQNTRNETTRPDFGALKRKRDESEGPVTQSQGAKRTSVICLPMTQRTKETTSTENFDDDAWLEVISYVDHVSLLPAQRLSSSEWSKGILTWADFAPLATFIVKRSIESNSYTILNKSTVPWQHVEFQNVKSANYPIWDFPEVLNKSLKTLTFRQCIFTWSWMMKIATRFQSLESLTIINCNMGPKRVVHWVRCRDSFDSDTPISQTQKRYINVKLEMKNYPMLNECLHQFEVNIDESPIAFAELSISIPEFKYQVKEDKVSLLPEYRRLLQEFELNLKKLLKRSNETHSAKVLLGSSESEKTSLHLQCGDIDRNNNLGFMLRSIKWKLGESALQQHKQGKVPVPLLKFILLLKPSSLN